MDVVNFPQTSDNFPCTKRVGVNFVDTDTGEVIYKAFKDLPVRTDETLNKFLQRWFDSFLRGVRTRNIAFLCEVKDPDNYEQLNLF